MNLPQQAHPGLPVVPHAVADELLGSWLLRIARFYGLSLREFVLQLSVLPPTQRGSAAWYELHQEHLVIDRLAAALHRSSESIIAMSAPHCDRRWPAELGFCRKCLDDAASAGTPSAWLRRWLHPLAVACEKHRTWLEPVTAKRLREIRRISVVAGSPRSSPPDTARQRRRELALIDGALWLEALVINSPHHYPPWGITDVGQLAKILRSLVQVLMSSAAADMVRHQLGRWSLPERRQRWACQTFRIDDGVNGTMSLAAPDCLQHRQFIFGLLGCYLHLAPANRGPLQELSSLIANEIPMSQLARWPPEALRWISPASKRSFGPRRRPPERKRPKPPKPAPLFST
jgi:hypothetical protein